jgi:AcrR family transcriptional regulator
MTHTGPDGIDRRVQRTRKLLQDAFVHMTIAKGFAAVTVRDITEFAGVNRATFYRHYQDKFDLLDHYAEEVYHLLDAPDAASFPADRENAGSERLPAGMVRMFEHIRAHAKFYSVMLGKDGDPGFTVKMRSYIEIRLRQSLPATLTAEPLAELYLNYVSSGSVGVVLWWLEHEDAYTPTAMTALALRLAAADLGAVLRQVPPKGSFLM